MKKRTLFFGLTLCLMACMTLLYTSCKKDDSDNNATAAPGTIKAKINGTNFTSITMASSANRVSLGEGKYTVTVQGNDQSGKGIVLVINGIEGPDTYAIGGGANVSISASYIDVNVSNPSATKTYQAPFDSSVAGEVSITELSDKTIKGTFEFTAQDNDGGRVTVSEGAFNMNF